jgi:predicted transcriptional regulator
MPGPIELKFGVSNFSGQPLHLGSITPVSMTPQLIRFRSARPGPERRMLKAALRGGLPVSSVDALILCEAALPTGVPDLIAVEPRRRFELALFKRRRLQLSHLKILHFLNDSGAATAEETVRLLNQSPGKTSRILKDLQSAGLIVRQRERFVPCSVSKVFVAKRIVAIEVKMRAWREALEQAAANLWFASHSYILVPALNCLRSICNEAKKLGIGVLVFDGKQTRTVLRPRRHSIPASYGSWLINEWALHQLK